jgi:hypothetical protein
MRCSASTTTATSTAQSARSLTTTAACRPPLFFNYAQRTYAVTQCAVVTKRRHGLRPPSICVSDVPIGVLLDRIRGGSQFLEVLLDDFRVDVVAHVAGKKLREGVLPELLEVWVGIGVKGDVARTAHFLRFGSYLSEQ